MNAPDVTEKPNALPAVACSDLLACCWSESSNGAWATGCGELWELNDGTPKENGMKFCPCCGRKLTESRYVDDIRDDHDDEYVAELAAKQTNESS